jgi:hypothetical protein
MVGGKRLTRFVNAPTRSHSLSDVRTEANNPMAQEDAANTAVLMLTSGSRLGQASSRR